MGFVVGGAGGMVLQPAAHMTSNAISPKRQRASKPAEPESVEPEQLKYPFCSLNIFNSLALMRLMFVFWFTLPRDGDDLLYIADPGRAISTNTQSCLGNTLAIEIHFQANGVSIEILSTKGSRLILESNCF